MLFPSSISCALALASLADAHISLGSASAYGVFAASTITSTGGTIIDALIGLSPGSSITGFPPGQSNGEVISTAPATVAKGDIQSAYAALAALNATTDLSGQDLGGLTLSPGVYGFSTPATLDGILTLDAGGNSSAQFIFQFITTLTTGSASQVVLVNGTSGCNVYWQVGSSATLGSATAFNGNIVAHTSITAGTGASIGSGGLFAITAAVTLDSNSIGSVGSCAAPVIASSSSSVSAMASKTATKASTGAIHTSTVIVTKINEASTTIVTKVASTKTVTSTVTTAKVTHTSTITKLSTKATTKTATPVLCPKPTSTKKASVHLTSSTSTYIKTVTKTETFAGHSSTVIKGSALTRTVKATHTLTATKLVTKSSTTTKTVTVTPKCTSMLARRNKTI